MIFESLDMRVSSEQLVHRGPRPVRIFAYSGGLLVWQTPHRQDHFQQKRPPDLIFIGGLDLPFPTSPVLSNSRLLCIAVEYADLARMALRLLASNPLHAILEHAISVVGRSMVRSGWR